MGNETVSLHITEHHHKAACETALGIRRSQHASMFALRARWARCGGARRFPRGQGEASDTLKVMAAAMIVQPDTHWFNGWFLRLCARAVVRVDGVEYAARWGRPMIIEVDTGDHRVAVGARYRGTRPLLGAIETRVSAMPAEHVFVNARNGFFNHHPFEVTTSSKSSS